MGEPDGRVSGGGHAIGTLADGLQLPIDALPGAVLVVGPQRRIAAVSRRAERDFGYTRDELVGQSLDLLLPGDDALAQRMAGAGGGGEPADADPPRYTTSARRKDGSEVPLEVTVSAFGAPPDTSFVLSLHDLSDRQRRDEAHRAALEDAVRFDHLAAAIAASFVNLPADQVDDAIRDAQRTILDALDLDRTAVFRFFPDNGFVMTHHVAREGVGPLPTGVIEGSGYPWTVSRIQRGESASFSSDDEIPDATERANVRAYNTKSRVAFPLVLEGRVAGAVTFAASRSKRVWAPEILGRLELVAQVFAGALSRRHAEATLVASEQRFRTLADDMPVLIWMAGTDGGCTWFNRQWLDFVGRPIEAELGDGWAQNVHPEDREACFKIYRRAVAARQPFTMEYRLRRHDGVWRWILDNGRPTTGADGVFAGYLGSCTDVTEQKRHVQAVEESRDHLRAENQYLRREVKGLLGTSALVGRSAALRHVLELVDQVAPTDSTVLLLGETGTGKELLATRIHELSARRGRPMVRVNCAAIPATLIESELFGREKGAFTGALSRQVGRFELADHSTIFLDEIGDLPIEVQVKLLRVLEERQIERLGSPRVIRVDTRIVAATHRNLEVLIAEGRFREDLFYRLNVFPIVVPPLRQRPDDIPLLVWRFVDEFSKAFGKRIDAISRDDVTALQRHAWPGNIRELRNVVERAMIVATGPQLSIPLPEQVQESEPKATASLVDLEREHIRTVLEASGWRIRGTGGAADRLGLRPTTLETRMAKLGITRPK